MSSRFTQNKGTRVRSGFQEPGSPGLPVPSPTGAGTPLTLPGCVRTLTASRKPRGSRRGRDPSGRAPGRHLELGKGNGNSLCNLIFVAVMNQHRDQVLRLP